MIHLIAFICALFAGTLAGAMDMRAGGVAAVLIAAWIEWHYRGVL